MIDSWKQGNNMTLKEQEVIMKVTVKEGIKGFLGLLNSKNNLTYTEF